VIRETQPEIYIGFTPTLGAGHGNHQQAGRYIWEGVKAAADPDMFPEQLTGPNALSTWQVKKVFSGGATAGTGGRELFAIELQLGMAGRDFRGELLRIERFGCRDNGEGKKKRKEFHG